MERYTEHKIRDSFFSPYFNQNCFRSGKYLKNFTRNDRKKQANDGTKNKKWNNKQINP